MAQVATLTEIERNWTLCDLADAHEALDLKEEAEAWASEQAKSKNPEVD